MSEIIPAKTIDQYHLGWSLAQIMSSLKNKELVQYREEEDTIFISYKYFKFWVSKEKDKVIQIGAYKGFKGNYNGIGIGSTLADIQQKFGSWGEDLYVYVIPKIDGLCFELADNDIDEEWIQESAPIEAIYVNDPDEFYKEGDPVFDAATGQYINKQ